MAVAFHPVVDNPIRMGHVPGWRSISDLTERLGDLEHAVGEGRVIPAHWEPYYRECPSCRYAGAYAWARNRLQDPLSFAVALALFPGEEQQLTTRIGHANWLILCAKAEPSQVTRRLMLAEALELWESHAHDWLGTIVETCARFGIETSACWLHEQALQALQPLAKISAEDNRCDQPYAEADSRISRGFDKDLLQMDGWTPNPGLIILPVDGRACLLRREILLLDLFKVVLLKARKSERSVTWDKISLVHVSEGALMFDIIDEPPLVVTGYKDPENVLRTVEKCYKAATERILQAVATQVIRPTP